MTLKVSDRVRENTTTVGSGIINLVGSADGFKRFTNVLSNGDITYYCIEENNKFEVGIGTYNSDTLTRDYVLQSTQAGNKINLGGSGVVFITYPADKAVIKDQESHVLIGQSGIKYYDGTIQKTAPASLNESIYISGVASYGSGLSIANENNILYLSGLVVNAEESLDISYVSGIANYASGKSIANKTLIDTNTQNIVYISGISVYSSGQSISNQLSINNLSNDLIYVSGLAVLAEESQDISYISGIAVYSSGKIYNDTYLSGIAVYSSGQSIKNTNDIIYLSGLVINSEESNDINYVSGIAAYVSGQNTINQSNISNLNSGLVYVSGLAVLAEESLDISYLSGIAIYSSGQSLTNQQSITQNTNDIIYISGLAISAEESSDIIYVSGIGTYASGQSVSNQTSITSLTSGLIYVSGIANYASGQSVQNKSDIIATSGWSNTTFLKETSAPFIYLSGLAVSAEESLDINYVSGIATYASGRAINNENNIVATSGWSNSRFATNTDLQYVSGIAVYVSGNALYNIVEDTSPQLGGNLDTNNYYISGVGNIIGGTGLFSSVKINNIDVSVSGHSHVANDITNFNTAVSGLIPVKNILASTGIAVSNLNGNYTISSNINYVASASSIITNVFNKTGSVIPKMSVIYINGGQGDQPTVALARADGTIGAESTSSKTYGITAQSIAHMGTGLVVVQGALTGLNTDQFNPSSPNGDVNGATLYLSPTISGGITTTRALSPYHLVAVGTVVRTHQNEGIIEVKIQNGYELEELHDVAISGITNGQFLQYNSASGLWVASSSGNFTTLQVNNLAVPTGVGVTNYLAKWNNANTLSSGIIYDDGTNIGIGTSLPSERLHVSGNMKTDGNLSFYSFTESITANGNSGTSKTLDLTNGTVHTCTLTGNCTFAMPATTAGKSFTLFLNTGAGGFSASFTGVRWASSTPPTITSTASKVDILSFISDGTYWYGSYSQNYG